MAERAAWRAVVHLNLVRSINGILDVLYRVLPEHGSSSDPNARPYTPGPDSIAGPLDVDMDDEDEDREPTPDPSGCPLNESHRALMLRLGPLRKVQRDLERCLGAASTEEAHSGSGGAAPWNVGGWRPREFAVTTRSGWKGALGRVRAAGRMSLDSSVRRQDRRTEGAASDAQTSRPKVCSCLSTEQALPVAHEEYRLKVIAITNHPQRRVMKRQMFSALRLPRRLLHPARTTCRRSGRIPLSSRFSASRACVPKKGLDCAFPSSCLRPPSS